MAMRGTVGEQRSFGHCAHCRMKDEFYIGWEAKAAPGIGRRIHKAVIALLLLAVLAPVVLAVSQRMIGQSVFEWGTSKTFSGSLQTQPYPHLLIPRPGS